MLLSKTVIVKWNGKNKTHYVSKGYEYTKVGDEFEVKVEDLTLGSSIKVKVKCDCLDCKNPYLNPMMYKDYLKRLKEGEKYYCYTCSMRLITKPKSSNTRLNNGKSFEQWCIENNRQDVLDRWDYELNNYKPSEVTYGSTLKYWFKCSKHPNHKSEIKDIGSFTGGQEGSLRCNQCNSLAQYLLDVFGEEGINKYWDYTKNKSIDPWLISQYSGTKIWIKCQEKDYHDSYNLRCAVFVLGSRCPHCNVRKSNRVHPKDSLGQLLEDKGLLHLWSDKNKKSPYEYAPMSRKKVYWRCLNNKHDDFLRSIGDNVAKNFKCPKCRTPKGEKRIEEFLKGRGIKYISQNKFKGLNGTGGRSLSYDFYLPTYNLLIEYQGEYHDGNLNGNNKSFFNLEKQQEHDRRKREYAKNNNIKLLEIWYWDYENIEQILSKELKLHTYK